MTPRHPDRLFHFTCSHAAKGIDAKGLLLPNGNPWLPEKLIWLTDLDVPHREALGLTNTTGLLTCDRTTHRYEVHPSDVAASCEWWPVYARRVDPAVRRAFESADGARPAHWYVSRVWLTILRTTPEERG